MYVNRKKHDETLDIDDEVYLVDEQERKVGRKKVALGDGIVLNGIQLVDYMKMVAPVSVGSVVGHILTQYSMIYANVSFIHTIKVWIGFLFFLIVGYFSCFCFDFIDCFFEEQLI